jgi:NAD(P)-dependent dehydrogenase (short-subunit alcohol dehydrogenase family)
MAKRDEGRRALVTGGSSGIGRELVIGLSHRRWDVEFCGRNEAGLLETSRLAGSHRFHRCDVTNPDQLESMLSQLTTAGPLDLLINNAGQFQPAPLLEHTREQIEACISTNLVAPVVLLQHLVNLGLLGRNALVINILSVSADTVFPGCTWYGASKAGLGQAMRVARQELRHMGIRICNVTPGATLTPAWGNQGQNLADRLMPSAALAECILQACLSDGSVLVEEMVLRPPGGDL